MATGIQQAAFKVQAETTLGCLARWLAEALSSNLVQEACLVEFLNVNFEIDLDLALSRSRIRN